MMSPAVTRPGAMLRASRKCAGFLSWRTLTWPKPSTTPWSNRMRFAATSSSISAGSAGGKLAVVFMRSSRDRDLVADDLIVGRAPFPHELTRDAPPGFDRTDAQGEIDGTADAR